MDGDHLAEHEGIQLTFFYLLIPLTTVLTTGFARSRRFVAGLARAWKACGRRRFRSGSALPSAFGIDQTSWNMLTGNNLQKILDATA